MPKTPWVDATQACADPQRAAHYLEQLQDTSARSALKKAGAEQARILMALFSGSQALSEFLVAHPEHYVGVLNAELLKNPRQEQGLRREVSEWLRPGLKAQDYTGCFTRLRQFKQKEMLRIAARDLARLAPVTEIIRELSDVAGVCLEVVHQLCWQQLAERLGQPYHLDPQGHWQPTSFSVLGLGKLGGQELNYSSDVDVIFVYEDEGFIFRERPRKSESSGKGLSNHQFFARLAKEFIAEVSRLTPEGSLYRIDLRLRPEGEAGPLARSLESCENYYAQWGQTWERMMLIKARPVAGDHTLGEEFLELIQPFRYPRSLGERILREIAVIKARIENEVVKTGEIDRNVKLGRGGIREIEFIAQMLQLLHAGKSPFLQHAQTLSALQNLVRYELLPCDDAAQLSDAYGFLRDIEHRLQMENNLQTHTIPVERKARERLAALMDYATLQEFEAALKEHTRNVRGVFDRLLGAEAPVTASGLPRDFTADKEVWSQLLAERSFRDPEKAARLLAHFAQGPGYVHVSNRTTDLAFELIPKLLALCPIKKSAGKKPLFDLPLPTLEKTLSDPDRVLARLDTFISAYGARAPLYELWATNPAVFELLVLLFDRSEFLAEIAIRSPDLVDSLELSGRLRRGKTVEETLRELRFGLADEDQRHWLRTYHQAELMRIGLRDILGLADFEQNLIELSALADACLQYALEVVLRRNKLKTMPIAIIGLGKLGGAEINYGSDLDITFVAESGAKDLAKLQKLGVEVLGLISSPTETGVAFQTDTRLRPDGEKGLLVNTVQAYEEYYRQRAQLWEIQSLSRSRPIAGNADIGGQFRQLTATLCNFQSGKPACAAFTSEWKREIARMRERIEKERTPPGKNALAIKTGTGGLMDAEFIAQYYNLAHGWAEPNTLRALQRARAETVLPSADAEMLIKNYCKLRRIEGILRRWSFAGETVLPDDSAPLYRVSVRCGFSNAEEFMRAVGEYRACIRTVYAKVFSNP